jgi:4-hydroxybenzoyl-CoA thioesterase
LSDYGGQGAGAAPPEHARARPTPRASLPRHAYTSSREIRFSDCDPAGIVYTPRFIDQMNGVIEDFFLAQGLDYHGLIRGGLGLGYAHVGCDFFAPASMGETLSYTVLVNRIGATSVALSIHAHRGEEAVLRGEFVLVTTSLAVHRPVPLTPQIRSAFQAYQDHCL